MTFYLTNSSLEILWKELQEWKRSVLANPAITVARSDSLRENRRALEKKFSSCKNSNICHFSKVFYTFQPFASCNTVNYHAISSSLNFLWPI